MSTTADPRPRPDAASLPPRSGNRLPTGSRREGPGPRSVTVGHPPPDTRPALELATLALVAAACWSLSAVFATTEWIRPTAGALLVTLGVAAIGRRARLALPMALALEVGALVVLLGVVFAPGTMLAGVVPTPGTVAALWALGWDGLAIIPQRVAPTAAVPPLVLLAVAGAGGIAVIADLLVHAGRAPLKAAVVAFTLWAVPLSMGADGTGSGPGAVAPMILATGLLLFAAATGEHARWGRWVTPPGRRVTATTGGASGAAIGAVAVVTGLLLAPALPGYGQEAWWTIRGGAGSTLAANPIVQLRSNLVASGTEPIFTVTSPRPVYLRTTSLDEYGEFEEWTNSTIRTRPLRDGVMARGTVPDAFDVEVRIGEIGQAELVPMPFQPLRVSGAEADSYQFDPASGTVALAEGASLDAGEEYTVVTAVPDPGAEELEVAGQRMPGDPMTALPDNVPAEVGELAEEIVSRADAETPFAQALAIQNELRSWEYSTDPPPGHDGGAMLSFIENRVGYCEQYAGTMAVMLRTLDIPARVAVGFTPGSLTTAGGDTYEVSWSNSHAWVEVRFPGLGWISFEPTPRGDGNVLVPSGADAAPATLVEPPPVAADGPASPSTGNVPPPAAAGQPRDVPRGGVPAPTSTTTPTDDGVAPGVLVGVALVVAGLAGGAWAWWARSRGDTHIDPRRRILAAGARVSRVGRGIGVVPRPSETDREYLRRLGIGVPFGTAGATLADALARARYAPLVDDRDADVAEEAAREVVRALTRDLSRVGRGLLHARGTVLQVGAAARDRVRRPRTAA